MNKIRTILGASILMLVSAQADASLMTDVTPLEGAELWKYSVQGSVTNTQDGSFLDISGSMLIDTTVREWSSPYSPRLEPCNCDNLSHILSFDLRIGDLSFFGGGPWHNGEIGVPGEGSGLYFASEEFPAGSGTFEYNGDWFLEGTGDYSSWVGQKHRSFNPDGTGASFSDIFQEAPAFIEMSSVISIPNSIINMNLTRVARVPEPPVLLLFGTGLLGLVGFSKRRKVV